MTDELKIIKGKTWELVRLNPMHLMQEWMTPEDFAKVQAYITFNPSADFQYKRRKQAANDGTRLYETQLIMQTLNGILQKDSWHIPTLPADVTTIVDINYEIGWLWLSTVYGRVTVPAGEISGQKQRTFIRVRSNYVIADRVAA